MLHEPAGSSGPDPATEYKTALGVKLFAAYCVVYALFVFLNVFSNDTMAVQLFLGLNVAVVFGLGLILLALVLALIYNVLCCRKEAELAEAPPADAGGAS